MKKKLFTTTSRQQTQEIAQKLGQLIDQPLVITASGDLGAGKTTFTQGLAKGLGIRKTVNSPTFTILKIYQGTSLPLYHIDAYRLEGLNQDLGFEEYIEGDGVCLIEWPNFMEDLVPENRIDMKITLDGENRNFEITATGEYCEGLLEEWL